MIVLYIFTVAFAHSLSSSEAVKNLHGSLSSNSNVPVDLQQSCQDMNNLNADGHTCGDRMSWLETYKGYSDAQAYKQVNSEYPTICVCDNPPSPTDGSGSPTCVFDIDGTLLGPGVNSDNSRKAIQACKDHGFNLAVNTAENDSECAGNRSKLRSLGLDVPDQVYTCLVNYDWGTSKSMNMRTISAYYKSAPQCTLLFDDTGGNIDAVTQRGWSGQKVYQGISSSQLQSGLEQLANCGSAPKPTPQPADCTGEDDDPWSTGSFKSCCSGLKKCLKKWKSNRDPYYLCEPYSESGCMNAVNKLIAST